MALVTENEEAATTWLTSSITGSLGMFWPHVSWALKEILGKSKRGLRLILEISKII